MSTMSDWKRIGSKKSLSARYMKIDVVNYRLPDGKTKEFEVWDRRGVDKCAGVIALTPQNKVVIAEQYRVGQDEYMQDIPGGLVEEDESPETAVLRELFEETTYEADAVEHLGKVYKDPYLRGEWHYFLATGCIQSSKPQQLERGEFVTIKLISIDELIHNSMNGRMTDVGAVLLAYPKLMEIKEGRVT